MKRHLYLLRNHSQNEAICLKDVEALSGPRGTLRPSSVYRERARSQSFCYDDDLMQNTAETYEQRCRLKASNGPKCCKRDGTCAILRGMLGTNSAGPTTGNGFDPRKHFPSKQGLISRGGSWPGVNDHIQAFRRMSAFFLIR